MAEQHGERLAQLVSQVGQLLKMIATRPASAPLERGLQPSETWLFREKRRSFGRAVRKTRVGKETHHAVPRALLKLIEVVVDCREVSL